MRDFEPLFHKGDVPMKFMSLGVRELYKIEGGKQCKSQTVWRTPREEVPQRQQEQSSYGLTETKAARTWSAGSAYTRSAEYTLWLQFNDFMGLLSV